MKCEICDCTLCGDMGHLCPIHYQQVKECINILKGKEKPKVTLDVEHTDDNEYAISRQPDGGLKTVKHLDCHEADALFAYMEKEHEDGYRDSQTSHTELEG